MADTKISGLPASTVPLAGTEVLPIVQSSTTKQVSIANVTAGRAVSALSVTTTKDTTPSSSVGAFSYGTLNYADVNHLATFQTSVASYAQVEIQNTSTDPAASSDMVVGNSLTTASTYYGDFGMNSSGWAGTAPFSTPNNVYLTSTTADLAIGTTTANAIRFATNSAEVARMFSSGGVSIGNSTDPGATNLSVTGTITSGSTVTLNPPSSTYASLPAASSATNQVYRVTDVGANNGTLWISNGTTWTLLNGQATIFKLGVPFIMQSSGSITVTTGVLTLTTALNTSLYTNCYMHFPANAWTGSADGWYYVLMNSATTGLVYSNTYTTGMPTIPTSPTLVTTGAGAYTQVTAGYYLGPNFVIPANSITPFGSIEAISICESNSSVGTKQITWYQNAALQTSLYNTAANKSKQTYVSMACIGKLGTQALQADFSNSGNADLPYNNNFATSQTIYISFTLATATDYCACQYVAFTMKN